MDAYSDNQLPFNPLRESLYTPSDLFSQYSIEDTESYCSCTDIQIYSYFVRHGRNPATRRSVSNLEALHDDSISQALHKTLKKYSRIVAIMGGHEMIRGTEQYSDVATIAYQFARDGSLVVSGGGPGAMEAAHLGALYSKSNKNRLNEAIMKLATEPKLPTTAIDVVSNNGKIQPDVAEALHRWLAPAIQISREFHEKNADGPPGHSLGIPTWLYGHEPASPLATMIAKYFQNSVREDGLVTIANQGILFTEGSAGTVQEIFQNAVKNFYNKETFCPMVFLSSAKGNYWTKKMPVRRLIEALFGSLPNYKSLIFFTTSCDDAVDFMKRTY